MNAFVCYCGHRAKTKVALTQHKGRYDHWGVRGGIPELATASTLQMGDNLISAEGSVLVRGVRDTVRDGKPAVEVLSHGKWWFCKPTTRFWRVNKERA